MGSGDRHPALDTGRTQRRNFVITQGPWIPDTLSFAGDDVKLELRERSRGSTPAPNHAYVFNQRLSRGHRRGNGCGHGCDNVIRFVDNVACARIVSVIVPKSSAAYRPNAYRPVVTG